VIGGRYSERVNHAGDSVVDPDPHDLDSFGFPGPKKKHGHLPN
jgi:hypothetical protein